MGILTARLLDEITMKDAILIFALAFLLGWYRYTFRFSSNEAPVVVAVAADDQGRNLIKSLEEE